jgi:sulfide:quinone oxidoreductase
MQAITIVVLGGGIGGMVAANEIRRQLPSAHRVVLVEKNARHAFAPSFLWLMTGDHRQPDQIRRPVAGLLRPGIEFVQAEVVGIDPAQRKVRTTAKEIAYDQLVVSLGADLAPDAIPGLAAAHTFFTFDGSVRLRDALQDFSGGRIAVVVSAMPYKCPGAAQEGAMLVADYFRRRGLSAKVDICSRPSPSPCRSPARNWESNSTRFTNSLSSIPARGR